MLPRRVTEEGSKAILASPDGLEVTLKLAPRKSIFVAAASIVESSSSITGEPPPVLSTPSENAEGTFFKLVQDTGFVLVLMALSGKEPVVSVPKSIV